MYELMLDTADLASLKRGLAAWPVCGVTCNPSILKKAGKVDLYEHLGRMKALCGGKRSLHVQVVATTTRGMIEDAHCILERLGRDTYIKIPVSREGLPAIKQLAAEGVNITATAIYSTMQGMLAVLAGAKYVAVYYNRMENNCVDPNQVIREIRDFIDRSGSDAKVLGASFKNVCQVTSAYANGAQSVTVAPEIVDSALGMASIEGAVDAFTEDFESVYGKRATMLSVAGKPEVNYAAS